MNIKKYIIISFIFLLLLATNIMNDKYYINYQNRALTVNNASESSRSRAIIYGDNTNQGDFIKTPKVDLPKGDYTITINYSADTDLNYIKMNGEIPGKEIGIAEDEMYLLAFDEEKVVNITLDEDVHNFEVSIYFCGQGTLVFKDMTIESVKIVNTDTIAWLLVLLGVFITIGYLLYYKPTEENKKRVLVFLALLGITMLASYPLFSNYIMWGHDSAFHLTRIEGIKSALLSGQFPVRVHTSSYYDYGYAASIFYPELFLYIPAVLRIMGVSTTGTVQIFSILINFATASLMYFSVYRISKIRSIGILSSILYVFASYHLCDVYTRFALGETLAMAFLPLLIYGVYELIYNDYNQWKYVVFGATGVLQSHIITTLVAIAFVLLVAMLCFKKLLEKNRIIACAKAGVVALLINLWYIVPLISMMRENMNVSSLARDVNELTLYVAELFRNFVVNGESRNVIGTSMDGVLALEIGLPIVLGVMLFIYSLVQKRIVDKKQENLMVGLMGFGILSAYATTNLFPWKLIESIPLIGKAARMIQFPWRLLTFATAFLSIVAAYGIFYMVKKAETRRIMIVVVFALSAMIASRYLDDYSDKDIYCYKGAIITNTGIGTGEYYYKGTDYGKFKTRGEVVETSSQEMQVNSYERENGKLIISSTNNSNKEQYIEVPLAYYPFYEAKLNQKDKLEIAKGENNIVRIIIPSQSQGIINIQYREPILWALADIVSVLVCIVFTVLGKINMSLEELSNNVKRKLNVNKQHRNK
jgi:hypothetical protein